MIEMFNVQKIFGPFPSYARAATLGVDLNGGTVTVDLLVGGEAGQQNAIWRPITTISSGAGVKIEINNSTLRVTPSSGAQYSFNGR